MRHRTYCAIVVSLVSLTDVSLAADWSSVDVRGIKTGMTFSEAEAAAKAAKPGARVTSTRQSVVFHKERFEYAIHIGSYYSDKTSREKLNIQMIPPNSINDGLEASRTSAVNYSHEFLGGDGILLEDFKNELVSKYGEPVKPFRPRISKAMWAYTRDGKQLTEQHITKTASDLKAKCKSLSGKLDAARKQGQEEYNEVYNQLTACNLEENFMRGCLRGANKFCPYRLTVSWRSFGGSGSHIRKYSLKLFNLDLSSQKNDRIKRLRAELESKFKGTLKPSGDIKL